MQGACTVVTSTSTVWTSTSTVVTSTSTSTEYYISDVYACVYSFIHSF